MDLLSSPKNISFSEDEYHRLFFGTYTASDAELRKAATEWKKREDVRAQNQKEYEEAVARWL